MVTRFLLLLLVALPLAGCALLPDSTVTGQLYTNIIEPHATDFRNSPVGSKQCFLDEHQIREPVSAYGITVEWSSDLILAAAHRAGISRISYTADPQLCFRHLPAAAPDHPWRIRQRKRPGLLCRVHGEVLDIRLVADMNIYQSSQKWTAR
jgi:hypothetical protein